MSHAGPCREQAHGAGAVDDDVALDDVAELGPEVPGRERIGEQDRVVVVQPVRDQPRTDIGERHPDVLGLAAVVPAARGRTGREILTIAAHTMGLPRARVDEMLELVSLTSSEAK